ncbi:MAG: hypothetical protein EBX41_05640 [Chitinophagia bacterium]|nr:hypothetical protein [Chitinophagia bacterium]
MLCTAFIPLYSRRLYAPLLPLFLMLYCLPAGAKYKSHKVNIDLNTKVNKPINDTSTYNDYGELTDTCLISFQRKAPSEWYLKYSDSISFPFKVAMSDCRIQTVAPFWSARFHSTAYFDTAQFHSTAYFSRAQFHSTAYFDRAHFDSTSNFIGAQFHSTADFGFAKFRSTAKFSYAVFHSTADFDCAKFHSTAYFDRAHFDSTSNFIGAEFHSTAYFYSAQFHSTAYFFIAQFHSTAYFFIAQFHSTADFSDALFHSTADFRRAEFHSTADFRWAKFGSTADFRDAKFGSTADFSHAHFHSKADFSDAQFGSTANFRDAKFGSTADFSHAHFRSKVNFDRAYINSKSTITFENATLPDTLYLSNIANLETDVNFKAANLDSTFYDDSGKAHKSKIVHLHWINLYNTNIAKVHIDYSHFRLFFTNPDNGEKLQDDDIKKIYGELLENFKARQQIADHELLDKKFWDYKLGWFKFIRIWNDYGYDKPRVFKWMLGFLVVFTFITFFSVERLNREVYKVENIPDNNEELPSLEAIRCMSDEKQKDKLILMRLRYAFVYTATIFLLLTLKVDKLKYKHKRSVVYVFVMYLAGLVCIAYIANFVIQK